MSISAWQATAKAVLTDGVRSGGASIGRTAANNLEAGVGHAKPSTTDLAKLLNQADEGIGRLISDGAAGQPRTELAKQAQSIRDSLRAATQIGNNPVTEAASAGRANAEKLVVALGKPDDLTPALKNPMLDEAGEAARNVSNNLSTAFERFGTERLVGRL